MSANGVIHIYTECFDPRGNIYLAVETTDFSAESGVVSFSVPRALWEEAVSDYTRNRQQALLREKAQQDREEACLRERGAHEFPSEKIYLFQCAHCDALKPPGHVPQHPKAVYEIALTLDHGFGLMEEGSPERDALLRQAHQLWEHHVKPLETR